jgi:hypothetical protein
MFDSTNKNLKRNLLEAYQIKGNVIKDAYTDGTYSISNIQSYPELSFLINSKYYADYLSLTSKEIKFIGNWFDGEFTGTFTNSRDYDSKFLGGTFNGGILRIPFNSWKTKPENFIDGSIVEFSPSDKKGILGLPELEDGVYDTLSILQVPEFHHVILTDSLGDNHIFQLVKKIDERGPDFIIKLIPEEKTVGIRWEYFRSAYESRAIIAKGKPFTIPGVIDVDVVQSIKIITTYTYAPRISDVIDFSTDSNLRFPKKIRFNFSSKEKFGLFMSLKRDVESGVLYDVLNDIRREIHNGTITGYGKFINLKDIFNNKKGKIDPSPEINKLMEYLNKVKLYMIDYSVPFGPSSTLISKQIQKLIDVTNLHPDLPSFPEKGTEKPQSTKNSGFGTKYGKEFGVTESARLHIRGILKNLF